MENLLTSNEKEYAMEYLNEVQPALKVINTQGTLKYDFTLVDGESRKAGDEVNVLKEIGDDFYHIQDGTYECYILKNWIKFR